MTYQAALTALSDPTRQAICLQLRAGPMPVSLLAQGLPVSRPAVSQHLKVLSDAGLVTVQPAGTRRLYGLSPAGLVELNRFVDALWDTALAAYADAATRQSQED